MPSRARHHSAKPGPPASAGPISREQDAAAPRAAPLGAACCCHAHSSPRRAWLASLRSTPSPARPEVRHGARRRLDSAHAARSAPPDGGASHAQPAALSCAALQLHAAHFAAVPRQHVPVPCTLPLTLLPRHGRAVHSPGLSTVVRAVTRCSGRRPPTATPASCCGRSCCGAPKRTGPRSCTSPRAAAAACCAAQSASVPDGPDGGGSRDWLDAAAPAEDIRARERLGRAWRGLTQARGRC